MRLINFIRVNKFAWISCAFVLGIFSAVSCTSIPVQVDDVHSPDPELFPPTASYEPTPVESPLIREEDPTPVHPHGLAIRVTSACSDGKRTILRLQTVVEDLYWGLYPEQSSSNRDILIETSIVFWENDHLFSTTSSGWRSEPLLDSLNHLVRIDQEFIFPEIPSPGSQFYLTAEVTLANLPANYTPPSSLPDNANVAPGFFTIPIPVRMPVVVGDCP